MEKLSAHFIATKVGKSTEWVYDMWKDMGLVIKDNYGNWILTDSGKSIGGKMSENSFCPVPTFHFEVIEKMMIDFYNKHKK